MRQPAIVVGLDGHGVVGRELEVEDSPLQLPGFPPSEFQELPRAMYDWARRKRTRRISEELPDHGNSLKIDSNPKLSLTG